MGSTRSIPEVYSTAGIRFDFSEPYISELASFVKEELEKV
jgi:oligoendopeptidase F